MIISYHGAIIGYDKIMKPFWGLYKYFFSKADKIHVLAPQLIDNDGILQKNSEKCVVIPYGVDLNADCDEDLYKKLKNDNENNKIILAAGRLVKLKGFNYLMEVMRSLNNTKLFIMGDGPLKEDYEKYIKENSLEDKIKILGEIHDEKVKNSYFKACDLLVVPSIRTESFGITQLEAMRYSKPVINTALGTGMNYVSIDGETGLTVEPENVEQLTEAINKLINNDNMQNQYGKNARKRVENLFDIEKIKSLYKELYCKDSK